MPVLIWLLSESLEAATHASETVLILIWIHKARPCNTSFHFCLNVIFSTCLSDGKRTAWEGPSANTICLSNQQQLIQGELPQTHSLLHRYPALVQPTDHEKSTPWPAKPRQPPSTNPPSGSQMGRQFKWATSRRQDSSKLAPCMTGHHLLSLYSLSPSTLMPPWSFQNWFLV